MELFVWLLLGHVFADFVWQSNSLVQRKGIPGERLGALVEHGAILTLCHLIAMAFYLSLDVALTAIDSSNEVLRRANDGALEPSQNDETQYLPYKYTPFTEW